MDENKDLPKLGPVVVRLMRGVVYRDQHEALWHDLLALQAPAMDYLAVMGLGLTLDEAEGYAFLHQQEPDMDDAAATLPRLIHRRPLSFPVSLFCVLLRKKLIEADAGGEGTRVILTRDQMVEMMRVFLPDQANEAKLVDRMDTHINKVVDLGFLRKLKKESPVYEVRRILKALVDADWLCDFEKNLEDYQDYAADSGS